MQPRTAGTARSASRESAARRIAVGFDKVAATVVELAVGGAAAVLAYVLGSVLQGVA